MWLCLCSFMALGSVDSLTIGYPYRTLLNYAVIRAPAGAVVPQGFLIYLDNNGIEHIVSYNYAESVYAIHRINFINNETPVPQNFFKDDLSEVNEAREAHYRAWTLQQYQVLKREIDLLREEGKEPSIELSLRFLPLEKIALTSDYSTIADLPDIKRIEEDHLSIWKKILQTNEKQMKSASKSINDNLKMSSIAVGMKTLAHEDQIDKLKPLQVQRERSQNYEEKTSTEQLDKENKSIGDPLVPFGVKSNKSEVESSDENEISASLLNLQSEKVKSDEQERQMNVFDEAKENNGGKTENLSTSSEAEQKQSSHNFIQKQPLQILVTSAVTKDPKDQPNSEIYSKKQMYTPQKIHSELDKIISAAPAIYVPQQVVNTAEVMLARDEHLKIVKEAILKAKLGHMQEQQKANAGFVENETKVEGAELVSKIE